VEDLCEEIKFPTGSVINYEIDQKNGGKDKIRFLDFSMLITVHVRRSQDWSLKKR